MRNKSDVATDQFFLAAWREARHRAIRSKSGQHTAPRASGLPAAKAGFPLLSLAETDQHSKVRYPRMLEYLPFNYLSNNQS
jgi:hypothetical protein